MEKEFLKMAEHAYKNIRRQDGSAESFVRFQKELSETNSIINESLSVLKNMKNICEHRHVNKFWRLSRRHIVPRRPDYLHLFLSWLFIFI